MPENKLFNVNIIITDNSNIPTIELRKVVKMNPENKQLFIDIISAAYNEIPITIMPSFSNKLLSIGSMLKRGWICEETDDQENKKYKILF